MHRTTSIILFLLLSTVASGQVSIRVHLDSSNKTPVSGRLIIYTSADTSRPIAPAPHPVNPQPMYTLDIGNRHGGETVTVDGTARAFSTPLDSLKPGVYAVAAILDLDPETRGALNNGNLFSAQEARLVVKEGRAGSADIYLSKTFQRVFQETPHLKAVRLQSTLLTGFHKKPVFIEAAVVLPQGYDPANDTRYPVVYVIPGWGGTHYDAQNPARRKRYGMEEGMPKIYVYLNPETQTPYGLHCFLDSRVNGPWGRALVEELVPYIRSNFNATQAAAQTFVVGQSSGGYAALWLPLYYPQAFGGAWAVSPDPVDFSDFVGVNLYEPEANFFEAKDRTERPFFIHNGKPMTTLRKTLALEEFEDNGGQFKSFEAAFGMPDAQGLPRPMFDRKTGRVDPAVVAAWQPYDLGRYVSDNWQRLSQHLSGGKLHVYAGDRDNYLLDGAVRKFRQKATDARADIVVELFAGKDHQSIWSPDFSSRLQDEMDALIRVSQ